jgi:UDP-N-acetylmuramoyl-L-alanyl-D-glutamate--2,6-diaminopimelate ligase
MLLNIDNIFILDGIRELTNIPGRMEKIIDGIYIDYAHTPLAMEGVINTTREIAQNKKIIVLFGCGGDRDRSKRAQMGKIATDLADIVIITSDNPRNEDQNIIINDIVMGVKEDAEYYVIPNRKEAIEFALKIRNDKILLLLGKGHEKYEIDSMGKHEFNEREIVETILSKNDKFN